jgi:hypothetical protein
MMALRNKRADLPLSISVSSATDIFRLGTAFAVELIEKCWAADRGTTY